MKKLSHYKTLRRAALAATVFSALCAASAPASAQSSRLYFAGYMGLNANFESSFSDSRTNRSGDLKSSNAPSFAGALGLRVNRQVRVEGEISYRNTDFSHIQFNGGNEYNLGGNLKTWLFMVNGYYDFDLQWDKITPYVSGGLGLAYHDGAVADGSPAHSDSVGSDIGFAWQVGTGLKYRQSDHLAFTGGYRYIGGSNVSLGTYDLNYSAHEFRLGLEYDIPVDFLK